ncbi:hypothetical protein LSH36_1095g00093 [Paralvinella palmiformis]|uniref:Probable RNA-binding protein 18 n=1 Tax=Paralvinella palmiformis TaxID=53620 RepID=A0AAD9IUY5_9ANNE|nr:hypothetical protein LSH36_1095g00093 [Paralvinella palmiformis]
MAMASQEEVDLPPPPDEPGELHEDGCRLWIGNLDSRVTEFSLLKLLQKYGELAKFDFLYHKSGPDQGKPRGYCFVTYSCKELLPLLVIQNAEHAKRCLDGKLALSKRLVVKNAKTERKDFLSSAVLLPKTTSKKDGMSKEAKIRAIEAKLHLMEKGVDADPVISGTSNDNSLGAAGHNKFRASSGKHGSLSNRTTLHSKPYTQGYKKSNLYSKDRNR